MTHQLRAANLDLAPIGNSRIAALLDDGGRIVWWCFPTLDGDPVFSRLLGGSEEKGFCDVVLDGMTEKRCAYVRNTPILETILRDSRGNAVKITDFAPRFIRYERTFHPPMIVRRIETLEGLPRIACRVRPTFGYGQAVNGTAIGSNHIRYSGGGQAFRLTTNAPLSYVAHETPFALTAPITMFFGPDEPITTGIDTTAREFLQLTREYWTRWVRGLGIPLDWQDEVIRAAITLKLCSFEETGAVIAALTTSIPEAPHTSRNWDYRYCWLRDAYFVVKALNKLGATQTMEAFLNYITTIAIDHERPLRPVYGIVHTEMPDEHEATHLAGFLGMGPVRVGNLAAEQFQHDAYGSIVLTASQMFIDHRLPEVGDGSLFHRLEAFGHQAVRYFSEPDAGIWEYRGRKRIHTHSASMCWVATDRLARIAKVLGMGGRAAFWRDHSDKMANEILTRAWNSKRRAFVGALDHDELDASVLLLADLGLVSPSDPRFVETCSTLGRELMRNGLMMRYTAADDFGAPETAFLVCQFWYIDALAAVGRADEAKELYVDLLSRRNSFGILSEDLHPATGALWGNLPQTYSMAGIINTAMSLSRPWHDAWRDRAEDAAVQPNTSRRVEVLGR